MPAGKRKLAISKRQAGDEVRKIARKVEALQGEKLKEEEGREKLTIF